MSKKIQYNYFVHSLSDDENDPAYKAIIPALNNAVVYGESLEELEEGINFAIESIVELYKKEGTPIPPPDKKVHASGRFVVRINPKLHDQLIWEAKANKMSLNKYVEKKLGEK